MHITLQIRCSKAVWGGLLAGQTSHFFFFFKFSIQDLRPFASVVLVFLFEALDELSSQKVTETESVAIVNGACISRPWIRGGHLHSLICEDAVAAGELKVVEQVAGTVDLDAAKNVFGPCNPAKVGRVAELEVAVVRKRERQIRERQEPTYVTEMHPAADATTAGAALLHRAAGAGVAGARIAKNGATRRRICSGLGPESVVLCRILTQHIVEDGHEPVVADKRARRRRQLGGRADGRGYRWRGSIQVTEEV